jgi:hypothetical protein
MRCLVQGVDCRPIIYIIGREYLPIPFLRVASHTLPRGFNRVINASRREP